MKEPEEREERRRELLLLLIIVPLGVLCMFLAGQLAINLDPSWELPVDLGSNLDPNLDFAAENIPELMEPINPNIMTQPVWGDLFLTPNAVIPTRIIQTMPPTPRPQPTAQPTVIIPTDNPTPIPTLPTAIIPPPRPTKPPPTDPPPTTKPPPTPILYADLGITKDDGRGTYTPGAGISYTIVVTNAGPSNASGFNIADNVPAAITGLTITCTPVGAASCGTYGSAGNNVTFTGASLNAGAANQITITISGTVAAGATGNLSNTVNILIPGGAGFVDPDLSNNSDTDTNTQIATDLSITKTDNATYYVAGSITKYTITVTNLGPSNVSGVTVTDNIPTQITSWDWSCAEYNGASGCTPAIGSAANFTDDVTLPVNASIVYTVNANINPAATGNLVNGAFVVPPPSHLDPNPGNNFQTDTDILTLLTIGPPDGTWVNPMPSITVVINPAIAADGDIGTPDFVYYERENIPGIVQLDWVQIEISSDGLTWVTVFYWGDPPPPGIRDTNSNMDYGISPPPPGNGIGDLCASEIDNCSIPIARMYNNTGVTIDIDAIPGITTGMSYPWIRITSPPGGDGDPADVDAIQPYYP